MTDAVIAKIARMIDTNTPSDTKPMRPAQAEPRNHRDVTVEVDGHSITFARAQAEVVEYETVPAIRDGGVSCPAQRNLANRMLVTVEVFGTDEGGPGQRPDGHRLDSYATWAATGLAERLLDESPEKDHTLTVCERVVRDTREAQPPTDRLAVQNAAIAEGIVASYRSAGEAEAIVALRCFERYAKTERILTAEELVRLSPSKCSTDLACAIVAAVNAAVTMRVASHREKVTP